MQSTYFSRLRSAVQNGVQRSGIGKERVLQEFESLIGQGKLRFCNYRLFHSVCIASLTDLQLLLRPGTVIAASSDSLLVNRRRNISVVGSLSRTFSVPSVSGPSFQVCGNHLDRALCDNNQITVSGKSYDNPMAASASRAVFRECLLEKLSSRGGHLPFMANNRSISYGSSSSQSFRKASMSLKSREQPTNSPIYGYFIYNVAKRWCNFSPYMESGFREFHCSSHSCFAAGTAPDVTYENSTREEQLGGSASLEQKISNGKTLKLLSGSCYLPHPDKEETGREDAHVICTDEQAVGVADGVGGWADHVVDSGQYSQELMSNSVTAIHEKLKGSIDPARLLEKAHSSTKAKGFSTACIIALADQVSILTFSMDFEMLQ